jgi:hypothetical protein
MMQVAFGGPSKFYLRIFIPLDLTQKIPFLNESAVDESIYMYDRQNSTVSDDFHPRFFGLCNNFFCFTMLLFACFKCSKLKKSGFATKTEKTEFSIEKESQLTKMDDYHTVWMIIVQYE